MPLRPEASVLPSLLSPLGAIALPEDQPDPQGGDTPGWLAAIKSAFRTENLIGSALVSETNGVSNAVEAGYNPWAEIVGTPYEDHWKSFVASNNPRYTEALKRKIDREEDDRRTLAAAGTPGVLANICRFPLRFDPGFSSRSDPGCW